MKKILSIALALCLALALTVSVFADGSVTLDRSPVVSGGGVNTSGNTAASKGTVNASINGVPAQVVFGDAVASGITAKKAFTLNLISAVDGALTVDFYCEGVENGDVLVQYVNGAWVPVEGATVKADGNRAIITLNSSVLKDGNIFAIVKADTIDVEVPSDTTTQNTDTDDEGDTTTVDDTEEPAKEENPKTGLALAVVPMVVAAAAIAISKRR